MIGDVMNNVVRQIKMYLNISDWELDVKISALPEPLRSQVRQIIVDNRPIPTDEDLAILREAQLSA